MAEIGYLSAGSLVADNPAARAADRIATLSRAAGGEPPTSYDGNGFGVRADRLAVVTSRRFAEQVATLTQLARNASAAATVLDVADAALAAIDARLSRMEALAEQGALTPVERADGSSYDPPELSARDRAILDTEFSLLRDEIDDIAAGASFGDIALLQGDPDTPGDPLEIGFAVGAGEGRTVTVSLAEADAEALSADLPSASLASESASDGALSAVEAARLAVDDIEAAVRGARAQLASAADAASEVGSVIDGAREMQASPEIAVDLARVIADRVSAEGGVPLAEGAERLLQELLMRLSSATANGGPAAGGDGIETFGGKTAAAPSAPPAEPAASESWSAEGAGS